MPWQGAPPADEAEDHHHDYMWYGLLTGCSAAAAARSPFSPSALSLRLRWRSLAVDSAAATSRSASSASSS